MEAVHSLSVVEDRSYISEFKQLIGNANTEIEKLTAALNEKFPVGSTVFVENGIRLIECMVIAPADYENPVTLKVRNYSGVRGHTVRAHLSRLHLTKDNDFNREYTEKDRLSIRRL